MIQPKVVIIGAGFGGLFMARQLAKEDLEILVIDRNNYHLFTPLLYQVATCGLNVHDVAMPTRQIFAQEDNIDFMLAEVTDVQPEQKQIVVHAENEIRTIGYDYLVVAAGAVTNYFGNEAIEQHAFSLKSMEDAVRLRNHIIRLYESLDWRRDKYALDAISTMVVVGGGPTGIETAGALYELYSHVLQKEYTPLKKVPARVILVEAMDRLLGPYPDKLQQSAYKQLESLGVEIILGQMVKEVYEDRVILSGGEEIRSHTLVWAAGVKASPLAKMLNVELQRGGRVPVEPTLEVTGMENVYAIGDIAYLIDQKTGRAHPQVIPVAQQQAKRAANNILSRINGKEQKAFVYKDKGSMATIGRSRAVAWIFNKIQMSGYFAWLAWLGLHLMTLLGFRNRASVFINWIWNYTTYDRAARVVLNYDEILDREENRTQTQEQEIVTVER
jgi:NADH dehydrogenase